MTPRWKGERWGYNIYQNEQNQSFGGAGPPYTLNREYHLMPTSCGQNQFYI